MENIERQGARKCPSKSYLLRRLGKSYKRLWFLVPIPMIVMFLLLVGFRTDVYNKDVGESTSYDRGEGEVIVIDEIRSKHLFPYDPSLPTNYSNPVRDKDWKQVMANVIAQQMNHKRNGFFIECGALDGVALSNTLLLEKEYDWTGLLVEADPLFIPVLKARNRKAWVADVCLSPQPFPMTLNMTGHSHLAGMSYAQNDVVAKERTNPANYPRKFRVDCFPLSMLLAVLNRREIDYLSLDVEGLELDILKTIPFDRIRIQLISVEVRPKSKKRLQDFLEPLGYRKIKHVSASSDKVDDDLYEFKRTP